MPAPDKSFILLSTAVLVAQHPRMRFTETFCRCPRHFIIFLFSFLSSKTFFSCTLRHMNVRVELIVKVSAAWFRVCWMVQEDVDGGWGKESGECAARPHRRGIPVQVDCCCLVPLFRRDTLCSCSACSFRCTLRWTEESCRGGYADLDCHGYRGGRNGSPRHGDRTGLLYAPLSDEHRSTHRVETSLWAAAEPAICLSTQWSELVASCWEGGGWVPPQSLSCLLIVSGITVNHCCLWLES